MGTTGFIRCVGAGVIVALAGCSQVAVNQEAGSPAPQRFAYVDMLPAEASQVLSENPGELSLQLPEKQQVLDADFTYFSASNRFCRQVRLTSADSGAARYIACQSGSNWLLHKALP